MTDIIPTSDIVDGCTTNVILVKTDLSEYCFDCIIVATGGISYPSTGSTGDGYAMAKAIGHTITDLKCGLCGVNTTDIPLDNLQGLALKNVRLTAKYNQKIVFSIFSLSFL